MNIRQVNGKFKENTSSSACELFCVFMVEVKSTQNRPKKYIKIN